MSEDAKQRAEMLAIQVADLVGFDPLVRNAAGQTVAGLLEESLRARPMTRTEHLLDILIEECAEVIQRATKAKRFGMQEIQPEQSLTNEQRITYELNDVLAVADMLLGSELWENADAVIAKKRKVEHFLEYSKECGTLKP